MNNIQSRTITGDSIFENAQKNNTVADTVQEHIKTQIEVNNMEYADLRGANTDKRYISILCVGSRKGMTTYCFDTDTIWCGCFNGTLEEFKESVQCTHSNNPKYLKEYLGFISYIESLK
ncbi:MAG: hypothetical protein LBV47_08955 [Bacteroidales bacterium]|jgi:hypothetical protein|nr:hypothetical protein [Bacteroidales bacterium]